MSLFYSMKPVSRYIYGLLVLAVIVNVSGLWVTIIGPDGTLYASVAKTMVQRHDYLQLFAEGRDWLDKPHFPFWVAAFSFKLFGFTTWAYKLPALLFLLMGAGYTYAFARRLYNKEVALWSVIILLTAEHIIISNNDVRAEPYLTGLIMAGMYHFYRALVDRQFGHLVFGALFAACAVMTKGLFALIPIGGAIAGELIIKKKWRALLHGRWLVAGVLVLLFITPEMYCLYYQFEAQPEKVVFGRQGMSGIRFFFWDSQFGRFFNTGPIKGKGDPLFFVHTVLWAFLPWSLLLYAGMYQKIKRGWQVRRDSSKAIGVQEWYTITGALLCFLMFSASRFQLPHYLNIVFPLFAIITAQYVLGLRRVASIRLVGIIQTVIVGLLTLLAVFVHYLFLPDQPWLVVVLVVLAGICWVMYRPLMRVGGVTGILTMSALAIIWVNLYLNLVFYPALLKYQSGSEAAFYANKHYAGVPVVQYSDHYSYPLEFYLEGPLITEGQNESFMFGDVPKKVLLYAPVQEMDTHLKPIRVFDHFHVSRLTLKLVNARTREKGVEKWGLYLVESK